MRICRIKLGAALLAAALALLCGCTGKSAAETVLPLREKDSALAAADVDIGFVPKLGGASYKSFGENQSEDVYEYIKAGYIAENIPDPRTASRKGGEDNPRIGWWENFSEGDIVSGLEFCNGLISVCAGGDASVSYTARTYQGDLIYTELIGGAAESGELFLGSAKSTGGDDDYSAAVPGVDYIIECEDTSALRLLSAEESRKYTVFDMRMNELMPAAEAIDYRIDGRSVTSGYVAEKAGIYRCTVKSLKSDESAEIYLEILPVNYKELLWGSETQREMDLVVQYFLNGQTGKFQQELPVLVSEKSSEENGVKSIGNIFGIDPNTASESEWAECFKKAEELFGLDADGNSLRLIDCAKSRDFLSHFPVFSPQSIKNFGDGQPYSAYYGLLYDDGNCETVSAWVQAACSVSGITSRFITNGMHAWAELLVPAEITESGNDQWICENDGELLGERSELNSDGYINFTLTGGEY